jgi:hypothetical protein
MASRILLIEFDFMSVFLLRAFGRFELDKAGLRPAGEPGPASPRGRHQKQNRHQPKPMAIVFSD